MDPEVSGEMVGFGDGIPRKIALHDKLGTDIIQRHL